MDFDQFVNILATNSLWLAPLSSMEDKREGRWIDLQASRFEDRFRDAYEYAANQTVVSSWAASPTESLDLWNSFAPQETGIAISTDIFSLLKALAGNSIVNDVFSIMKVEYLPQPKVIELDPPVSYLPSECAKYKSADFQYENEVRIVYGRSSLLAAHEVGVPRPAEPGTGTHIRVKQVHQDTQRGLEIWAMKRAEPNEATHTCIQIPPKDVAAGVLLDYSTVPPAPGTHIKIKSMRAFMKNGVYVSPRAHPWMFETVKSVLQAYGCDPSLVHNSEIPHFQTPTSTPFEHNITYE